MGTMEVDALPTRIYDFLYRLGLNANLFGFQYLSAAVFLSIRTPERFGVSAEEIYPEVSRLYCAAPDDVRRSVRRALYLIWKSNPAPDGKARPSPLSLEEFLSYARQYLAPGGAENNEDETPETNGETVSGAMPETNGETVSGAMPETNGETMSGAMPETNGETMSGAMPEKRKSGAKDNYPA